jgi:hypothetical protein
MACVVIEGTKKQKNGVGDSLCADVRLEVKITRKSFIKGTTSEMWTSAYVETVPV